MSVCAIIPIKRHSQRVPGKNFCLVNGKPLFYYIINTLLSCNEVVKTIIINIDNNEIIGMIMKYFPHHENTIKFYKRPKYLEGGEVSVNKIIKNTIDNCEVKENIFLQTHVTNPLVKKETILNAIEIFKKSAKNDSLFSVRKWQTRLYNSKCEPINHDLKKLIQTQKLEPLYEENSCIYLFRKKTFLETGKRIGKNPFSFIMNNYESQDIDWPHDLVITELIMKRLGEEKKFVIITGVNGGIGSFMSKFFKRKGWSVIGLDIRDKENKYCDYFYQCNVGEKKDVLRIKKELLYNGIFDIDLIINNAAHQICKKWVDTSEADWETIMRSNLKSVFLISKYFKDELTKVKGNIINISSVHSSHTSKNIGAYATSKGAITTLTRSMAIEYGEDGVRVNCVAPGAVNTKMLMEGLKRNSFGYADVENSFEKLKNKHVLKRVAEPLDIAEMVYFLSDNSKAGFITGQTFYVDGGATIKLSTE